MFVTIWNIFHHVYPIQWVLWRPPLGTTLFRRTLQYKMNLQPVGTEFWFWVKILSKTKQFWKDVYIFVCRFVCPQIYQFAICSVKHFFLCDIKSFVLVTLAMTLLSRMTWAGDMALSQTPIKLCLAKTACHNWRIKIMQCMKCIMHCNKTDVVK